jgi:hypothetical protein
VPNSILEAIRKGVWDFEPDQIEDDQFDPTEAMPGTNAKLEVLARRIEKGLPLWHSADRTDYDSNDES